MFIPDETVNLEEAAAGVVPGEDVVLLDAEFFSKNRLLMFTELKRFKGGAVEETWLWTDTAEGEAVGVAGVVDAARVASDNVGLFPGVSDFASTFASTCVLSTFSSPAARSELLSIASFRPFTRLELPFTSATLSSSSSVVAVRLKMSICGAVDSISAMHRTACCCSNAEMTCSLSGRFYIPEECGQP